MGKPGSPGVRGPAWPTSSWPRRRGARTFPFETASCPGLRAALGGPLAGDFLVKKEKTWKMMIERCLNKDI